MPLQIQPDESLVSYVRRNLHLNWGARNMGIFDNLATRHVAKRDIVQASLGHFTSKRSDCSQIELLVNLGKQSAQICEELRMPRCSGLQRRGW